MTFKSDILPLLHASGKLINMQGAPRISCHQEDSIWFLEEGSLEIFVAEENKSQWETHPKKVAELTIQAAIFPVPFQEGIHFTLAPTSHTKLWIIPFHSFEKWAEQNKNLNLLSQLLSIWVNALSHIFRKQELEPNFLLSPNARHSIKKGALFAWKGGENFEEKNEIKWIEIESGDVSFSTFKHILLPKFFPLSSFVTLHAVTESVIFSHTQFPFVHSRWQESLKLFHDCFARFVRAYMQEQEKEKKERIVFKKEKELEDLDEALHKIAETLEEPHPYPIGIEGGDQLFKACQIIGSYMGYSFQLPKETWGADHDVQIKTICRLSSIQSRKVTLNDKWWKKDAGPLIGFWSEEKKAVALIPEKFGYGIIDSTGKKIDSVNDRSSKLLDRFAYVFYPPLPANKTSGWRILVHYLKKNRSETLAIVLSGMLFGLLSLFPPTITKYLFDRIIPSQSLKWLAQVFSGLIISAFSLALFFGIRALSTVRIEGVLSNQIQSGLWSHLLSLPVHFFRKYSIGDLFSRTSSVEQIHKLLSGNASQILLTSFFSLFYLLVMFLYSPLLSFFAFFLFFIGLIITLFCLYKRSSLLKKTMELKGVIYGHLLQMVSGVGKLRVASAEIRAYSHWAKLFARLTRLQLKIQSIQNYATIANAILPPLTATIIFAGYMFFLQSSNPLSQPISLGSFLGFYTAYSLLSLAVVQVTATVFTLSPIYYLWHRVRPILDATPEKVIIQEKTEALSGAFSIDHVSFRYNQAGPFLLNDLTIEGEQGDFIAIVGHSGCGKSTLINLMLGFEKPEKGGVYYNGKDLQTLDIREIRRQIGIVLQNDTLLTGTILENIVCGRIFSKEEIERALDLSTFSKDLTTFPMGLNTVLSVGGGTLSGGQRQKLLIARALVGNPKILIFDEATSALDNTSQDILSKNIASLNMTRICVAHRLSTIQNADRIYFIDKGRVIESGTFQDLESKVGPFSQMVKMQKL